jgi:ATP-binding cassette subfamily B protein
VAALSDIVQTAHRASGALRRINEILDAPLAITDRPGAAMLKPVEHEIRLEHVSFGYESERLVLHDLNLRIPAGGRVAIVGASGSGKSTLIKLLLRFIDPTSGSLSLDGSDARDVRLDSLRGQMGVVFQETFLFDMSVRENIALGQSVSDAAVAAAAIAACLDGDIQALPGGYETVLGERGMSLSGGQRQRLAWARAFVKNPRILLLDEATSALDLATEREILAHLDELAEGRTIVMVTHRLGVAAAADWIVVLEDGRVAQQGCHDDLLRIAGAYRNLWLAGTYE